MITTDTISTFTTGTGTEVISFTIIVPLTFGATTTDPEISMSYSYGTPFMSGSAVIIPMKAKISATYVNEKGIVYRQQEFTEDFQAGYTYTAVPSSIAVVGNPTVQTLRKTKCCKSYELMIQGSIAINVTA